MKPYTSVYGLFLVERRTCQGNAEKLEMGVLEWSNSVIGCNWKENTAYRKHRQRLLQFVNIIG